MSSTKSFLHKRNISLLFLKVIKLYFPGKFFDKFCLSSHDEKSDDYSKSHMIQFIYTIEVKKTTQHGVVFKT